MPLSPGYHIEVERTGAHAMQTQQIAAFIKTCHVSKSAKEIEVNGQFGVMARFDLEFNVLYSNLVDNHPAITAMRELAIKTLKEKSNG